MLVQRQITMQIALGNNPQSGQPITFAESGTNQLNITGALRTSVRIMNSGNPAACSAEVKVWGLTQSIMNQLSTLGLIFNQIPNNTIVIQAGVAGKQPSTVFQGVITNAYGDYEGQPDVPFVMIARIYAFFAGGLAAPTSFTGPFDVATAMASLARQMGAQFINNGVTKMMPPMYLTGSAMDQIGKLARAAHIDWGFPDSVTLQIWPLNSGRTAQQTTPTISPQNPDGSISYPSFTQSGIIVKTVFNPLISLGQSVQVVSSLLSQIASVQSQRGLTYPSSWVIVKLDHDLDTLLPHGQWMSVVYAYSSQVSQAIQPPT